MLIAIKLIRLLWMACHLNENTGDAGEYKRTEQRNPILRKYSPFASALD